MNPFLLCQHFFFYYFIINCAVWVKYTVYVLLYLYTYQYYINFGPNEHTNFRLYLKAKISIFFMFIFSSITGIANIYFSPTEKYVQKLMTEYDGVVEMMIIFVLNYLPQSPFISPELKTMSANLDMKFNYIRFRRGSTLKFYTLSLTVCCCVYIKYTNTAQSDFVLRDNWQNIAYHIIQYIQK